MINQSLSGSPRRRDGPLKKVPIPRSIDELINDVNDMHRRAENTQLNAEELKKENE